MRVLSPVLEAIGNTPITREQCGRFLSKLDYLSPGASLGKDRAALKIIEKLNARDACPGR